MQPNEIGFVRNLCPTRSHPKALRMKLKNDRSLQAMFFRLLRIFRKHHCLAAICKGLAGSSTMSLLLMGREKRFSMLMPKLGALMCGIFLQLFLQPTARLQALSLV